MQWVCSRILPVDLDIFNDWQGRQCHFSTLDMSPIMGDKFDDGASNYMVEYAGAHSLDMVR